MLAAVWAKTHGFISPVSFLTKKLVVKAGMGGEGATLDSNQVLTILPGQRYNKEHQKRSFHVDVLKYNPAQSRSDAYQFLAQEGARKDVMSAATDPAVIEAISANWLKSGTYSMLIDLNDSYGDEAAAQEFSKRTQRDSEAVKSFCLKCKNTVEEITGAVDVGNAGVPGASGGSGAALLIQAVVLSVITVQIFMWAPNLAMKFFHWAKHVFNLDKIFFNPKTWAF